MLVATRVGGSVVIEVEHLNFGKLVDSQDGLIRAPDALGVTRRSRGLVAERDGELRLSALLDVQIFSTSLIDPVMEGKGVLLVRTLPRTPTDKFARTVIVRARFRQDTGAGADRRPHQQASIWVLSNPVWRECAASILARAETLEAIPDRADEPRSDRFDAPAERVELLPPEDVGKHRKSEPVMRILDAVLPKSFGERGGDHDVVFGRDAAGFATEAQFLAAVGCALHALPEDFARWDDICIGSGLRNSRPEILIIRYLPSEPTPAYREDRLRVRRGALEKAVGQPGAPGCRYDPVCSKSRRNKLPGSIHRTKPNPADRHFCRDGRAGRQREGRWRGPARSGAPSVSRAGTSKSWPVLSPRGRHAVWQGPDGLSQQTG